MRCKIAMKPLFLLPILATPALAGSFDPASLPQVVYHPTGIAYWDTPFFADAVMQGNGWLIYQPGEWGQYIASWNHPSFNPNGYPQEMIPGYRYRAVIYGLHTDYDNRPSTWPARGAAAQGKIALTWVGDADIQLHPGGTFLPDESSGAATGRLVNGRRTYRFTGGAQLGWLEIHDINPANPIQDIDVWLPDPADPENATLEGQRFHPRFLARLADADWGVIRFMDWSVTNANPQQDWSDRRVPDHAFMNGALNPRPPAANAAGDRATGTAWEYCVALCNDADLDLWINVPHLATDDYVYRLARLIRFGSDGVDPYTAPQANPVWAPLEGNRRVFVEYSNEIWSNGYSFPQGDWAQQQATAAGISKAEFNAQRFCEVFRIFQEVFGGTDRLVRMAATFTANDSYTQTFLERMQSYGPTLSPPVEPDVIAVTTYFGNGIQDWAHEQALALAGTLDP